MRTLAAIDIGTVSTRLIVARVAPNGAVDALVRDAQVTDLGEGVDASGELLQRAIDRTCAVVADYVARIDGMAGEGLPVEAVATTTTSAARDASNAAELLGRLTEMGLAPQVIDGGIEARLALLGVTGDFPDTDVLVADIGGGSTELTVGGRHGGSLAVGASVSYNVGCRRVAERYLAGGEGMADTECVAAARSFVAETLGAFKEKAGQDLPRTLVCVGGTATSLVAVANRLVPYDSAFVHLHETSRDEVARLAGWLLGLTLDERRALAGLQPKRAAVIGAGALILDELMGVGGWDRYVASEADSLFGLLACARCAVDGLESPVGWRPVLSR